MTLLRRLMPDDWRIWRNLRLAALRQSPESFDTRLADWQGDGDTERRWRDRLAAIETNYVAEIDGVPTAMVSAGLIDGGTAVELTSLWVAPTARGRGVGALLVRAVLDWSASETAADRVLLHVRENDPVARALYRRHGFRPAETHDPGSHLLLHHRFPHRVRIGIHSGQQYPDFASVQALWHSAERLGYDWVSLFDHYRPPIFGPDGPCLDGPTLLSALAATTPRIRCALLVTPPVWRHPALTATIAATIDQISGGRLELGVGVGGADLAFAQYGILQPPLSSRYEQLAETCHVLRLLWNGGPADFVGRHYQLSGAHLNPRPVQHWLPLVIGGTGERRTLPVVARYADVWNSIVIAPEAYAHKTDVLDRLCAQAGRERSSIRRSLTFRAVVRSSDKAVRTYDSTAGQAPSQDLSEYVSLGGVQECVDRLAPYAELGVRDFILGVRPPLDMATVERFAAEVAPVLRRMTTR